ncbi:MAG: rhomboid family intramembrane serine protease [Planctomycetota bacterium]|nr:rhomboid family intramembrane serine protease [Planctomycetota bacterium]
MGIYDRDWVQGGRRAGVRRVGSMGGGGFGGGGGGWRSLTVTHWLIIACALIYFIEGFARPKGERLKDPGSWTLVSLEHEGPLSGSLTSKPTPNQPPEVIGGNRSTQAFTAKREVYSGEKLVGVAYYQNLALIKRLGYFSTSNALIGSNANGDMIGGQVWRFITFQFLHADFTHLLVNMFGLWIFGPLVEQYLGRKRFLAFYLLCGICGALFYLLLNAAGAALAIFGMDSVPFLLVNNTHQPLIGASAGVFGVLLAGAYLSPNSTVLLFFLIPMRLVTLCYGLIGFSIFVLLFQSNDIGSNAGGEAAHLGGAIAGFYFIRRPHHLHGFFDLLGRVDPTSTSAKVRKVRGGNRRAVDDAEIDRILAKIHAKGLHSLNAREKKLLRECSKR